MAQLRSAQKRAEVTLKRAIPSAEVKRSYTLLLNGLAVELPAKSLAKAVKLSFAHKVYPSLRYTLATNRSPGLIDAAGSSRVSLRGGSRQASRWP